MTILTFLYPIVDSGYFFTFEWLEANKTRAEGKTTLSFYYRLGNNYPTRFQIPIKITHLAHLDCGLGENTEAVSGPKLYSRSVVDLTSGRTMYGYGDDHYVLFEPLEGKEFRVIFPVVENDFATFDTEFFMQPEGRPYGLYRLRYDCAHASLVHIHCLRSYPPRPRVTGSEARQAA